MRMVLIVAAALTLAGCRQAAQSDAGNASGADVAANNSAEGNVTATVLAMSDHERNVVFIRALIDSKLPCDGVLKSNRVTDQNGLPMWNVECKNGSTHYISITPDGTANVMSRKGM
jgi:hypothetical protein